MLMASMVHAQQWQLLGSEQDVAAAASNHTTIALVSEGATSTPYVAYTEGGVARVKKQLQDGTWAQVGEDLSAGSSSYTRIYADATDSLYVTYVDGANSNRLAVKKFNPTTGVWEPLNNSTGNLYVSEGTVNGMSTVSQYGSTPRSSLVFDAENNPYIAFADGANLTPYVKMFDGTSWVTVGSGPVKADAKAAAMSLVLDEVGTPWLVFSSLSANNSTTGSMALYRFDGGTWTAVPANFSGIRHTSMAVNSAGNLVIAYFNTGNLNRATVVVYNKATDTWSSPTSLASRDSPNIHMTKDAAGNLFLSFIDAISSGYRQAARVFKQEAGATAWAELKDQAVATGIDEPVGNLALAVGSDTEKPVIVYTKTNGSGVVTPIVRMYLPPAPPAVISTKAATNISTTSVVAGGDITSDGGSEITERGVVYGTSANPTTANTKVAAASAGIGSYTVNLTGLTPATSYFVRAYAINGGGTTVTYGANVRVSTHALPDEVVTAPKQVEYLNRGLVAVRTGNSVYVGWRLLGTDPAAIAFNVYRDNVKLNSTPITTSTNYVDNSTAGGAYTVRAVVNGVEGTPSEAAAAWGSNQLSIPLQIPAGGTTPDGQSYTYTANDASVGDMDGDGTYEVVLRWAPTVENHNMGGYSGKQIFDCYKLDGTRLWRIDLGHNMPAGPHYNQFMVYDFDGDGKSEIILKTADGTVDGTGAVIGNAAVDYRNSGGWVHTGPEFLTVFNGLTGAAMATVDFQPARGNINDWGDNYGNRADRFVSAVAYLDGVRPSLIMGRGYYNKLARAAYDWRDGQLTLRWIFNSEDPGNEAYREQGNHQMTIGDVDGDGKDEIINGSSAINDDGKPLWTYRYGHGDALHMTDMDPDRPGQEIWINLESQGSYDGMGLRLYDAKTGETVWGVPTTGDVGRSMAADIDPNHKGYELWGSSGNLYNARGQQISTNKPTYNFGIWWDGDLARELLDGTKLDKWNAATNSLNRLFTIYGAAPISSNNSTKANPSLTADLLGDWREEMLFRTSDNARLILFTTTIPTEHRIYTLMHDPQYRTAIAWQNSAYNQPPYPGFYLGYDMQTPPMPNITLAQPGGVTGITKEKHAPQVLVYPNPSNTTYTVVAQGKFTYTVFDQLGRRLHQADGQQSATFGQDLKPGVYFIRVETSTGHTTERLLKQ